MDRSFRFTPVTEGLENLSDELKSLGGGNACVGKTEVICRLVSHVPVNRDEGTIVLNGLPSDRVVWTENQNGPPAIFAKDPSKPQDASAARALKQYHVCLPPLP